MSLSNAFENSLCLLIFNNTNIADIGDATGLRGSTTAGSLYISLHIGDPGEAGTQATSECTHTSYARVAVVRSGAGFTVSGNAVSNTAVVQFPTATGGSETATHAAIGVASSGATVILAKGALITPLAISTGIAPKFEIGDLDFTID
jgi:hypothetical protein